MRVEIIAEVWKSCVDARSGADDESEEGFGLEKQNGQGGVEGERVQQGEMDGGKGTGESLGGGMAVQDKKGGEEYEKGPGESLVDGAEEEIELETEEEDSSFLTVLESSKLLSSKPRTEW